MIFSRMLVVGVIALIVMPSEAPAQAYCKLRDPVSQIKALYPAAEDYRSIVRTVDNDARNAVAEELPFKLHFNELGRHTLYVAQENGRPVGLVHARSEKGRWGLVEIIWALDFDTRIQDFTFQRCRSPYRGEVESDAFKSLLKGKSLEELGALISSDGEQWQGDRAGLSAEAMELGLAVVRSAMKTMVVTRRVWESDLRTLGLFYNVMDSFESVDSIDLIKDVYSDDAKVALGERGIADSNLGIDREGVKVLRVLDAGKKLLGLKVLTPWQYDTDHRLIWWALTPESEILEVSVADGWPDPEIAEAFEGVLGMTPDIKSDNCSSFASLIACEVIVLATTHRD